MTLYKIRAWVNRSNRQGRLEHPYEFEAIVVNKKTAKRIFKEQVDIIKNQWEPYRHDSVKVTLFVPHIFEDGTLAYWPDDEKYIDQYNPNNL
jgi:hypothetical protein